ncbi:MAG: bifunctional 4'-phosphopantothenoylcysteine decarboxylase/phosphopantothenoylcysteine synthetase, partial [Chloroflexi bacterium]|nr:bifunctional 4'-phosphopantothenoylcysteine decarboxylase/phosphopantothenoylcysteine synthetase [Chloroflexota bacterium]
NARGKLRGKGLDLVVANDISAPDAGFAVDSNRVTVLDAHGGSQRIELSSKASIAASLIQRISSLLG